MIKHALRNFVAALAIFVVAVGLAYVERFCEKSEMPSYLCKGITFISVVLFWIDGIVVCGTAAIAAARLLLRTWRNDDEK